MCGACVAQVVDMKVLDARVFACVPSTRLLERGWGENLFDWLLFIACRPRDAIDEVGYAPLRAHRRWRSLAGHGEGESVVYLAHTLDIAAAVSGDIVKPTGLHEVPHLRAVDILADLIALLR